MSLLKYLAHPLTKGMDIDDPQTTAIRRKILRSKPFLEKLYREWYSILTQNIPDGHGKVLELGSGAGFFKEHSAEVITSEVFYLKNIDAVLDASKLPFRNETLKAICMVDVFHHIPDSISFLEEASRCLMPGGKIVMIEPWVTFWSSIVWDKLHHEPFDPNATDWRFPTCGPLSGANSALPWIVCHRDKHLWQKRLPDLKLHSIHVDWPFCYLASGGVSMRSLIPGWSFSPWRLIEKLLRPLRSHLAMFAAITINKTTKSE